MAQPFAARSQRQRRAILDHIRIKQAANGGHTVEHVFTNPGMMGPMTPPKTYSFGAGQGQQMLQHVAQAANVKAPSVFARKAEEQDQG
jgi:hypothetical protein